MGGLLHFVMPLMPIMCLTKHRSRLLGRMLRMGARRHSASHFGRLAESEEMSMQNDRGHIPPDREFLERIANESTCEGDCDEHPPYKECPGCFAKQILNEVGEDLRNARSH